MADNEGVSRGCWVAAQPDGLLCLKASAKGLHADEQVRVTCWQNDWKGWFQNRRPDDILVDHTTKKWKFHVGDTYNNVGEIVPDLVILLSLELATATTAIEEVILVIQFRPENFVETTDAISEHVETLPEDVIRRGRKTQDSTSGIKTLRMQVISSYPKFPPRERYEDTVRIGLAELHFTMHWRFSRMHLSETLIPVRFRPNIPGQEEIMNELRHIVSGLIFGTAVFPLPSNISETEKSLVPLSDLDDNLPAAAVNLLSLLDVRSIALFAPDMMKMLSDFVQNSGEGIPAAIERKSNSFVIFILVLAKVCDDSLHDDMDTLKIVLEKFARTNSPAVLFCFAGILIHIVQRTEGRLSGQYITDSDIVSEYSSRLRPPGYHAHDAVGYIESIDRDARLKPVVLALCTTVLAGLNSLRQQFTEEEKKDWTVLVEGVLTLFCGMESVVLGWGGLTRLYPECLLIVDPTKVARDLKAFLRRNIEEMQQSRRKSIFYLPDREGFVIDCLCHVYQQISPSSIWKDEILPSTETWLRGHLLKHSIFFLRECLSYRDCSKQRQNVVNTDGFEALVHATTVFLRKLSEEQGPYKLDPALMTMKWALRETWPFLSSLLKTSCTLEYPLSPFSMDLLELFASSHENLERQEILKRSPSLRQPQHQQSELQKILFELDSPRRIQAVSNVFRLLYITVSAADTGQTSEVQVASIATQVLRVTLDTSPSLANSSDPATLGMWDSIISLLLFGGRVWKDSILASWAIQSICSLLIQFYGHKFRNGQSNAKSINRRCTEFIRNCDTPWFVRMLTQGLIHLGCTEGIASAVLDLSVDCLNEMLRDPSSRATVCAEVKLALYKLARFPTESSRVATSSSPQRTRKGLDIWLVHVEDRLQDESLRDATFALRTLGAAAASDRCPTYLLLRIVSALIHPYSIVQSPLLAPGDALVDHRRYESRTTARELEQGSEIELLLLSLNILKEAESRSHGIVEVALQKLISLQIKIQLQLCGALDEVGKDILVQELEVVQRDLLVVASSMESQSQRTFFYRLSAITLALVEDALRETLAYLWSSFMLDATFPELKSGMGAALMEEDIPMRRVVFFDPLLNNWTLSGHIFSTTASDLLRDLTVQGVRFHLNGERTSAICLGPTKKPAFGELSVAGKLGDDIPVYLFPCQGFANGFVVFSISNNDSAYRIEMTARKGGQIRKQHRASSWLTKFLLPERAANVSLTEIPLVEALKQKVILTVTSLRMWLENEVWLEQFDPDDNAAILREGLHHLIASEIIDGLSPNISGEDGIGVLHALRLAPRDKELGDICAAFLKVVGIALSSFQSKGERYSSTKLHLEKINSLLRESEISLAQD